MGFLPRFTGAGFEPCVEVASPRVSVESIRYTSARWCVHGAAQIRRGKLSGRTPSAARRDLRPTITLVPPPSPLWPHHHSCGPTITLVAPPSLLRPYHLTKRTPYGGISIRPVRFCSSNKSKAGSLNVTGWFGFVKVTRKQNSSLSLVRSTALIAAGISAFVGRRFSIPHPVN